MSTNGSVTHPGRTSCATSPGSIVFTVALVASVTNAGVATLPCRR